LRIHRRTREIIIRAYERN